MKLLLNLILLFVLISCNRQAGSNNNTITDSINLAVKDSSTETQSTLKASIDCSSMNFKTIKQQCDTLLKYVNDSEFLADERFFCAFPNTFKEMENLFGYDDRAAPLYHGGDKIIAYFKNLNSIPKEIYYNKYINICVNGVWEADNISDGFGIENRIINDPENICSVLAKRKDSEIISVFHFIFDGPHPNNELNEKTVKVLFPILSKQDARLGKLMKEAYHQVLSEEDEHGH